MAQTLEQILENMTQQQGFDVGRLLSQERKKQGLGSRQEFFQAHTWKTLKKCYHLRCFEKGDFSTQDGQNQVAAAVEVILHLKLEAQVTALCQSDA